MLVVIELILVMVMGVGLEMLERGLALGLERGMERVIREVIPISIWMVMVMVMVMVLVMVLVKIKLKLKVFVFWERETTELKKELIVKRLMKMEEKVVMSLDDLALK